MDELTRLTLDIAPASTSRTSSPQPPRIVLHLGIAPASSSCTTSPQLPHRCRPPLLPLMTPELTGTSAEQPDALCPSSSASRLLAPTSTSASLVPPRICRPCDLLADVVPRLTPAPDDFQFRTTILIKDARDAKEEHTVTTFCDHLATQHLLPDKHDDYQMMLRFNI